jgi:hypothetical protein
MRSASGTTRAPAMPDASRSSGAAGAARGVARAWRLLSPEQRVAGVAAALLIVSTFGPFSFVELAIALVGLSVLALLRARAQGHEFHLPFGDGTAIAAAGLWCGLLIVIRIFDRPLGQNMLALGCALLLFLAGARERAKRPADDLPAEREAERDRERTRRHRRRATWGANPSEATVSPLSRTAPSTPSEAEPGRGRLSDPAAQPLVQDPPEMPDPGRGRGGPLADPATKPLPEDPPEMPAPRRRRAPGAPPRPEPPPNHDSS